VEALPNPGQAKLLEKENMDVVMSGSCACVALLHGRDLFVANSGDARAVLGQENEDGTYSPMQMSFDHNAANEKEVKRLLNAHPQEHTTMIRDGRLLEMLLPFRAFGDIRFKWTAKQLKEFAVPIYGHGVVPSHLYTPPYVTAVPEIVRRSLNYKDKFLVLATDGLWDFLTPEKVVKLIGDHLNGQQSFDPYLLPEDRSIKLSEVFEELTKRRVSISLQPIDHNSATHLIRNALGNDHLQLSNYLRADAPRNIRDDITITIVYFDTEYIIEKN
jgi:pyruvate dehydrogenase phosphatase